MWRGACHRVARVIAAGVVVAALAACGPDAAPDEVGGDARAGSPSHQPGPRNRAAPPSTTVTPEDVARLAEAWRAPEGVAVRARLAAELGSHGAAAFDALVDWFVADPSLDAWDVVEFVVVRHGAPAFAALAGGLARLGPDERVWVAVLLGERADAWRFDAAGEAVCRALVAAVRSSDGDTGFRLLEALAMSRPAARAVAEEIGRLFVETPAEERWRIVPCIEALGTAAAAAAPVLFACLRAEPSPAIPEGDTRDVSDVVRVLRAIGPAAPEILPGLAEMLADGPRERRLDACTILAEWGEAASTLAPALVPLLADYALRLDAARALRGMPSVAESLVVEVLVAASARDVPWFVMDVEFLARTWFRDPAVRSRVIREAVSLAPAAAGEALRQLSDVDPSSAGEFARSLTVHADPQTRALAAEHLARLAGGGLPPELVPLLSDPEPLVRVRTARALAENGALGRERVAEVVLRYLGAHRPRREERRAVRPLSRRRTPHR